MEEEKVQIKVVFSKLTELILQSVKTKKDVIEMFGIVGEWSAMILASLILMLGDKDIRKALMTSDKVIQSINMGTKRQLIMIKNLMNKEKNEEKSKIIT